MQRSKLVTLHRLLGVIALWVAGVLAVGAVGVVIKLMLSA